MTIDQAKTAPLHEVWHTFKMAFSPNGFSIECAMVFYTGLAEQLRPILLERCKEIPDAGGQSSLFSIDGDTLLIENTIDRMRHDDADTIKNFAAACDFWAAELELLKMEVKGGN